MRLLYIGIPTRLGRYLLGAVREDQQTYIEHRRRPKNRKPQPLPETFLELQFIPHQAKILIGAEVLAMSDGYWRRGILNDAFFDMRLYEVMYRNNKKGTVEAKNIYVIVKTHNH